jgi:cell division protein ZapC
MLLMPQKDWQWRYKDALGVLSISLGDEMEFFTPYRAKLLIPDALSEGEFTIEHARFYIELLDRLQKVLSVTDAALVQTALNATAAHFMLKPQMPKSWYFDVSDVCVFSEPGKLFELKSCGSRALVLVVGNSLQAAQVMLLSKEITLSDAKVLQQFDSIKIMHNRLHPLRKRQQTVAA